MKYKFSATATVSCYTEVEADSLEEALEEAYSRELSGLCYAPFTGDVTEEWHFDNDSIPEEVKLAED